MNQQEVRQYIEEYFSAFQSHVVESHPHYLSVKLTPEVDKDIGNRPFYWSWVERMNIPPQPMTLTFFFDPENTPSDIRGEQLHFGAARLHQIFQSTQKHGRFVCLYEHNQALLNRALLSSRRSTPLTPWLSLNLKISFICDKRRDLLLHLGMNLHQLRVVHDFYSFLGKLNLSPAIPDYFYTLDRRVSLDQALQIANQEIEKIIGQQDHNWADQARERLADELELLEAYYAQLALEEKEDKTVGKEEEQDGKEKQGEDRKEVILQEEEAEKIPASILVPQEPVSLEQHSSQGGRILDFLRMNGIPQPTKVEELEEWKKSTPEEEKRRRMDELRWQYEPRIEVKLINGGLFYLHNMPPF